MAKCVICEEIDDRRRTWRTRQALKLERRLSMGTLRQQLQDATLTLQKERDHHKEVMRPSPTQMLQDLHSPALGNLSLQELSDFTGLSVATVCRLLKTELCSACGRPTKGPKPHGLTAKRIEVLYKSLCGDLPVLV